MFLSCCLRAILPRRRGQRRHGQVAVAFIVFMALLLMLASMTMNLGQAAQLKTETANAADSGALAGASWVASGTNEMVFVARGMSINAMITELIFAIPFCLESCPRALSIWAALVMANNYLLSTANKLSHGAWDTAHAAALMTAISNAPVDAQGDDRLRISREIDDINEKFRDTQTVVGATTDGRHTVTGTEQDFRYQTSWQRIGADGRSRTSTLQVDVAFLNSRPDLSLGGTFGPIPKCWSNCFGFAITSGGGEAACNEAVKRICCLCICIIIQPYVYICPGCVWPCYPSWGWDNDSGNDAPSAQKSSQSSTPTAADGSTASASSPFFDGLTSGLQVAKKAWINSVGKITPPSHFPSLCNDESRLTCLLFPGPTLPADTICPGNIDNSVGKVRVRVTLQRKAPWEPDPKLPFWQVRYPAQILSEATAKYGGASVGGCFDWHSPNGFAELTQTN